MTVFEYVRFRVNPDADAALAALERVWGELRKDKESQNGGGDGFREPGDWHSLFPPEVRAAFAGWSADEEARREQARLLPISETPPDDASGHRWDFYSMIQAFEDIDVELHDIVRIDRDVAEARFYARGYPYGGVACMIALIEAFGFEIVGVDDGLGYVEVGRRGRES